MRAFTIFAVPNAGPLTRSYGGLAQLARALAWHARGHGFDSRILHNEKPLLI